MYKQSIENKLYVHTKDAETATEVELAMIKHFSFAVSNVSWALNTGTVTLDGSNKFEVEMDMKVDMDSHRSSFAHLENHLNAIRYYLAALLQTETDLYINMPEYINDAEEVCHSLTIR
jgi:hypothetical protein